MPGVLSLKINNFIKYLSYINVYCIFDIIIAIIFLKEYNMNNSEKIEKENMNYYFKIWLKKTVSNPR